MVSSGWPFLGILLACCLHLDFCMFTGLFLCVMNYIYFIVICARGKAAKDHPGNQWFRSLVEEHIQEYSMCECKLDKSFVVSKVLKRVRQASPHGGFVKRLKGKFWEVGDRLSREKIGQVCAHQRDLKRCSGCIDGWMEKVCSL
jgi:hypothetical protein